jgi:hypothetical protein
MIAPTEKDWILLGLEDFHKQMIGFGFDMDKIQGIVAKSLPKYTMTNGMITLGVSLLIWAALFSSMHLFVVKSLMYTKAIQKSFPSTTFYKNLSKNDQCNYTSYIIGIIHSMIAFVGAVWCFFYADGEVGTTWYHCNYFKMHMFDVQKYLHTFSGGYLLMSSLLSIFT